MTDVQGDGLYVRSSLFCCDPRQLKDSAHKKAGQRPAFHILTEGSSGLEIPLELNAGCAVITRCDKRAAELGRHDHFTYVLLVKEIAGKRGHFPSLTPHAYAQVGDAVGINLGLRIACS